MKFYLIVFATFCYLQDVKGQMLPNIWDYYSGYRLRFPSDNDTKPFLVCAIPNRITRQAIVKDDRYITDTVFADYIFSIWKDTALYSQMMKRQNRDVYFTFDTASIHLFAQGVNKENADHFRYRLIKNDSLVINDWTKATNFIKHAYVSGYGEDDSSMAFLGELRSEFSSKIKIEIKNLDSNKLISTTTIYWAERTPELLASFGNQHFNEFMKVFRNRAFTILEWNKSDSIEALFKLRSQFSSSTKEIIFFLKDWVNGNIIEYKLDNGDWTPSNFEFQFVWLKELLPGKHILQIRYNVTPKTFCHFEFEILPNWYQTGWFKLVVAIAILSMAGFIFLLFRSRQQRQLIREQANLKLTKELELKSIRSQLNPHFVLNALNSIQTVFLQRPKEEASRYLSNFANLLRDSLGNNSKEWNPLLQEISLLREYLELEQLRFRFSFTIDIDKNINTSTVEVPTLLLQPLVENAVKHGVSSLREKGMIKISLSLNGKDMIISIQDNGEGRIAPRPGGFGLQLTLDRIALIKQLNPEQIIEMDNSSPSLVILTFKNWLEE